MKGIKVSYILFKGKKYNVKEKEIYISKDECHICKKVLLYPMDDVLTFDELVECEKCYESEDSEIRRRSRPTKSKSSPRRLGQLKPQYRGGSWKGTYKVSDSD